MKQLTCEMCGSTDLIKQDGFFVCQTCGCKYSVEEAKKMMNEKTDDVKKTVNLDTSNNISNNIDNKLKKLEAVFQSEESVVNSGSIAAKKANQIVEEILDLDFSNAKAHFYHALLQFGGPRSIDEFVEWEYPFNEKPYAELVKFADDEIKSILKRRKEKYYQYRNCLYNPEKTELIKCDYHARDIDLLDGVTTIREGAFSCHEKLESILIPEGVTSIGKSAFSSCTKLENVVIPDSVTSIGESAFHGCTRLKQIQIPEEIKTIAVCTFAFCKCLENITIPKNVVSIEAGAFESCESLNRIAIPEGVTVIGNWAFSCCNILEKISIPKSVTTIGLFALTYKGDSIARDLNIYYDGSIEDWNKIKIEGEYTIYNKSTDKICDKQAFLYIKNKKGEYVKYFMDKNWKIDRSKKNGCYVATCVYGSYDCPEVWTLRRYRDNTLASTWYGRAFIKTYYAISPSLVKWFGKTKWFKKLWKGKLDRMVKKLNSNGVPSTSYNDKNW